MNDIVILLGALLVILLGAELFTNGIEWFGHGSAWPRGRSARVLAAVGTALPETMIPLIAILVVGGGADSDEIGIGAILGAPFMLATLAMFVTGVAVILVARAGGRRGTRMAVNGRRPRPGHALLRGRLRRSPSASRSCPRTWPGRAASSRLILVVIYAIYVREHFQADPAERATTEPSLPLPPRTGSTIAVCPGPQPGPAAAPDHRVPR